ncbi:threonine/serine exporter family protein [Allorhodopirellula solitaria]|uniref:Uncharacterized protein n=1 Tax=Allorhodopirellula solitaria TaxID=2527987 RepID=A0A5C5YGE0_9BACT|nr:MFS transporter [Allorhodopirellula solitaria]TWT74208.1 hypothetical protein CA85_10950 [Allorhodopirellula solitaria]
MNTLLSSTTLRLFAVLAISPFIGGAVRGQDEAQQTSPAKPIDIDSSAGDKAMATILVEAHGKLPEPPVFYTTQSHAEANVTARRVEQSIDVDIRVIQGHAETLILGIHGDGEIVDVTDTGQALRSWSVRQADGKRYLDLQVAEETTEIQVNVQARSSDFELPADTDLLHLTAGESVGFDSNIQIDDAEGVQVVVTEADGFVPVSTDDGVRRFQTTVGGRLRLSVSRSGTSPGPVEWIDTQLHGVLDAESDSMQFELRGTAEVSQAGEEVVVLGGRAAISEVPDDPNYRVRLANEDGQPVYKLFFPESGSFPITIHFVAGLAKAEDANRGLDFTVAAGSVVPLTLEGLGADIEFARSREFVSPERREDAWIGFLPATGHAHLRWNPASQAGEGKLFFTTSGQIEAKLSAGLLRQDHQLSYHVLQGEIKSLQLRLHGPGEVLDVRGSNIVRWEVTGEGEQRELHVTLSQPMTGESSIHVRSQTPLGAFPIRVAGLRLEPVGAIRYSGLLRIINSGSVRLEPIELVGLTQLSPDQFPGDAADARQVFVYRYPAAEYAFAVSADRIQPEVDVSELVVYELSESDRTMHANIEMDIREAPIREWDFAIPPDYSVVAVTGASVADYVTASEVEGERRNLKVLFSEDVSGRQLVVLHLEKSEAAVEADWVLPRMEYPGTKTVRGDIGISVAAGFRISVAESEQLTEKPLAYFPQPSPRLQHAFRIRQPDWSATLHVEMLQRSVQSDVFHLYSLSDETIYGSALINYFVTGSPVSQWKITVPEKLGNLTVDGEDVRTWRRDGDTLVITLHQAVMGASTVLVTFEEKTSPPDGSFRAGVITPLDVQSERGYIQVVSPMQVKIESESVSDDLLKLDPLELPAELRLLTTAPPLGTWQYTARPFDLNLLVEWFQPGTMVSQVVEFADADSHVSADGELVTNVTYFVKSRGQRTLRVRLPEAPVRLWEVSVDGTPVTARQADEFTLIPLPGGADPNVPVEVRLRLGKPSVSESTPELMLPSVDAPLLKVQWSIVGDENRVLAPGRGTVSPPRPVLPASGLEWTARHGLASMLLITLLTGIGIWGREQSQWMQAASLVSLAIAIGITLVTALAAVASIRAPLPLQLSLPILSAGAPIELNVFNIPRWRANLSWLGLAAIVAGVGCLVWSFLRQAWNKRIRWIALLVMALGLLWQGDTAGWFFALLAVAIFLFLFLSPAWQMMRRISDRWGEHRRSRQAGPDGVSASPPATAILLLALLTLPAATCFAVVPDGFVAADSMTQEWHVTDHDKRLSATGTMKVSGSTGDQFVLLNAPAVLTQFDGGGLRLSKREIPGQGLAYIVSIPGGEDAAESRRYEASFEYQLEDVGPQGSIPILSGDAAFAEIRFHFDQSGWQVHSPNAVRIEAVASEGSTQAVVLLGPGEASLSLSPQDRDVATEQTQFYVEASQLYLPAPGVVDGRHRLHIRPSQGQVRSLRVIIPEGVTVSSVAGPIAAWQFDADRGNLLMEISPPQSEAFDIMVETQRGLDPLPSDVTLAPLRVADAVGEVGFLAVAFGSDAQPEKLTPHGLSVVNLSDFDTSLLPSKDAVLHRVLRYGSDGGDVVARIAPVAPEVRVTSQQVLSLGEERMVIGVNFHAEITRAGLFQLSFPLPAGLEVESLSGPALHHWSERSETDQREIVLHLNGKTIGMQSFSLTLTGPSPADVPQWQVPRFELNEAARQSGGLVVRPATGIRLRTISRQNVSEADVESMTERATVAPTPGGLAYRLLQRDWTLVLGIEQLAPWVTGQVMQDVTLREGQTRTALVGTFEVQNASIQSLQVRLPLTDEDEIKTLRASGRAVSDLVRTAPDSDIWEIQFKRRVIGDIDFRIEYERRGDREGEIETVRPAAFPQTRQLSYYVAVRAGGRLELRHDELPDGWQRVDWNSVPPSLVDAGTRSAPVFTLRSVSASGKLIVHAERHALADALKLRVAKGSLTTVLSPTGDQLTAVELTVDVIQRSSLQVGLPAGGELFSIFVNGESVHSIRQSGDTPLWQFTILPGMDDRTADVRFVYSANGDDIRDLVLISPELNVPLENIQWSVVAPQGFELVDQDGNLELVRQSKQNDYDRRSYIASASSARRAQAERAAALFAKANQLLRTGEQSKASWALQSVTNQHALDAASNEDARIQLENLQTRQAIVGLNTRRQRIYLDNNHEEPGGGEDQQLRAAAGGNPVLQQNSLDIRPGQFSDLLSGNTTQDNAFLQRIAAKLVQHQRTAELPPQAILISLPREGAISTFTRSVQVAEGLPMELDLDFAWKYRFPIWRSLLAIALLTVLAAAFVALRPRQAA